MKKFFLLVPTLIAILLLSGCNTKAKVASDNLSKAADNFEVFRRVVFLNVMHDTYILSVEGYCSIGIDSMDDQMYVVCKTGPDELFKHYLGRTETVTYFVQQLDPLGVSEYHHRIIFRPDVILPTLEVDSQLLN